MADRDQNLSTQIKYFLDNLNRAEAQILKILFKYQNEIVGP